MAKKSINNEQKEKLASLIVKNSSRQLVSKLTFKAFI